MGLTQPSYIQMHITKYSFNSGKTFLPHSALGGFTDSNQRRAGGGAPCDRGESGEELHPTLEGPLVVEVRELRRPLLPLDVPWGVPTWISVSMLRSLTNKRMCLQKPLAICGQLQSLGGGSTLAISGVV